MSLIIVVFFGAFMRWFELFQVKTTVADPFGDRALTQVKE
jgi:hypothetical protein